jgi:hypothetical protein
LPELRGKADIGPPVRRRPPPHCWTVSAIRHRGLRGLSDQLRFRGEMAEQIIPDDVRDFILRHIDSVAQLEALLLLHGNPNERWDIASMTRRLYTTEAEVVEPLARLVEDGLLCVSAGIYRYDCAVADHRDIVDRLAVIYSRHLIAVTHMIHGKPRRIRQFADEFKFRKDR